MRLLVKSRVSILKVANRSTITKIADEFFSAQFRNAIRAWLREVLEHIPEYTGTARGTFKPLARANILGRKLGVSVPKGQRFYRDEKSRQYKLRKGYKVIAGRRWNLGPGENDYAEFLAVKIGETKYMFSFTQNLPWAIWNDIYPAPVNFKLPSNPPWFAIEAGNSAWKTYIAVDMPTRAFYKELAKVIIKSSIKSV